MEFLGLGFWLAVGAEVAAAIADGDAGNRDIDNHHWRK